MRNRISAYNSGQIGSTCCCETQTKPIGNLLDDLLGIKEGESLVSMGVSIAPQSILMLSAGVVVAGLIIKNVKF